MRAARILKYGKFPVVQTLPLPQLSEGTSLVKMHYAPINPSDLNFFTGTYGVKKELPATMGFEGSGVVSDSTDRSLIGRVVSVRSTNDNGTHATHILLPNHNMVVWPSGTKPIDVACAIVNPLSAIGMLSRVNTLGYGSVLLSASNSELSRMMIRYFTHQKKQVYGMVRNINQREELLSLGAADIFVDTDAEHHALLKKVEQLKEKVCFLDCIGGDFAGSVFNSLPAESTMVNYGRLSKQRLGNVDVGGLYYQNKRIQGFWLNTFMRLASKEAIKEAHSQMVEHFSEFFTSRVGRIYKLEQMSEAMHEAAKPSTPGKIILDCS